MTRRLHWTDAAGRQWKVWGYTIHAGEHVLQTLENGQYRLFVPVDGGARRSVILYDRDRALGLGDDVLAAQLARATLFSRDDPDFCAQVGLTPERADPPT